MIEAPLEALESEVRMHPLRERAQVLGWQLAPLALAVTTTLSLFVASEHVYGAVELNEVNISQKASGTLPQAVEKQIDSAVLVERSNLQWKAKNGTEILSGYGLLSGVALGNGYFISAGHGVISTGEIASAKSSGALCSQFTIFDAHGGAPHGIKATDLFAQDTNAKNDMAIYKTNERQELSMVIQRPPAPNTLNVATEPLHGGEVVYFINWEPTASGEIRQPGTTRGLDTPVVFSGVVLKDGATPLVATDIKSYGHGIADKVERSGMSGGGVYNSSGELVGLSNYGEDNMPSILAQLANFKIAGLGLPGNGKYNATITPVTRADIARLEQNLQTSAVC